ncbi:MULTISPECIES: hypothetical protein [unclassified Janthinobacterium]|uniref:hypothetical protein n=1 Tax=unclassified Janthinobacterium TaxID=2610881 RepID=UPI0016186B0F|nr:MULTISPECIES: hypothetical protein [unclassified Janthinobacterium]MBB5610389.1 hypothetical protein [Janthinobacterium sp. S3T4]MBB5615774.1 hypothetical protein [Janthinobacterium sp. S3M3]
MNVTSKVRALLPLQRASHREIVSKEGALVVEVMSAVGVGAANELEALIVAAVNSHEALVAALSAMVAADAAGREISVDEISAATEALALVKKA